MKGTIYISKKANDIEKYVANALKKHSYKIVKKNDIEDIVYVDNFSNTHVIDSACNGLQCDEKILQDTILLLKKTICLGSIDKKMLIKEFKKHRSTFLKAYTYLHLEHKKVKITSFDEAMIYTKQKNIEIIPKKISKENIINTLYDMIKAKSAKNNHKSVELKVKSTKNSDYKKFMFLEITDFILTDRFPKNIKLTKEKKEKFEILLANSISLNEREKTAVLEELSTLSLYQIEALIKAFLDEQNQFSSLQKYHKNSIVKRQKEAVKIWEYIKENIDTFVPIKSAKEFYELLSEYIIGQKSALKDISIPLYHHKKTCSDSYKDINFGPIMLTGPTGSGKSFIVEKASKILNLDYIHIDCSVMVSEGIVGQGVQDIFKLLLQTCKYEIKRANRAIVFLDEFDKLLTNLHSDSIIPQFLRAIEGARINITKSQSEHQEFKNIDFIDTHEMFFILGGSFEYLLKEKRLNKSGFIKQISVDKIKQEEIFSSFPRELAGRIKRVITLNSLSEDDFFNILTKSKKSPLLMYKKIFSQLYHTDISFTKSTLRKISKKASQSPYGARILNTLVSELCDSKLFEINNYKHQSIEF